MKQKLIRNEHDWCVSMLEFWHSYSNSFAFIRIVKFFIISLSALAHAWMSQVFFWIRYTKRGFDSFFICTVRGFFLAHLSLFDWNWASNLLDSLFSFSPFSLDSREFYAGNGYKKNHWFFLAENLCWSIFDDRRWSIYTGYYHKFELSLFQIASHFNGISNICFEEG